LGVSVELFAAHTQRVVALDGANLSVTWERSFDESPRIRTVSAGDRDDPGTLYVGLADQRVLALAAESGSTEWESQVGTADAPMMPTPILSDVTGDGTDERIAVTNGGTVAVLDADSGSELAAYERDVPVWTYPSTADIDGDGDPDILVRYGDGRVVALNYDE
jgi:outer membrane protein assembly factor BamB